MRDDVRKALVRYTVLFTLGCSPNERDDGAVDGSDTGMGAISAAGDGIRLDLGGGDDTGGVAGDGGANNSGCDKVDFLFVIDSSNSMETNQAALIASFPEFVAGIQSALSDVNSYHVGVVTSDAYPFNDPGCTDLGALVTRTGGKDSGNDVCGPFAEGHRFMTQADELPDAFSCAAQVGTDGDNDEAMMAGALAAISGELNGPGGCNEGFVRLDAVLVLVLITDEDDPGTCVNGGQDCDGTPGDPDDWYEDVIAVKQVAQNVVVLSLTRGAPDDTCGPPEGTETDGDRIMQFVQRFGGSGLIGDVCAESFGGFFERAVDVVQGACQGFVDPIP